MNQPKIFILILIYLLSFHLSNGQTLTDCPKSPNCVCTTASKKSKRQSPIPMKYDVVKTKELLTKTIQKLNNASLVSDEENELIFEVITKTGKFTDDVIFQIDPKNNQIHFRSASRKGYYDFGANKRRMKKISREMMNL